MLFRRRKEDLLVRLGEYDLNTTIESDSLNIRIRDKAIHEDYDPQTYQNDIAMLTLDEIIDETHCHIWRICYTDITTSWAKTRLHEFDAKVIGKESPGLLRVTVVFDPSKCGCSHHIHSYSHKIFIRTIVRATPSYPWKTCDKLEKVGRSRANLLIALNREALVESN